MKTLGKTSEHDMYDDVVEAYYFCVKILLTKTLG